MKIAKKYLKQPKKLPKIPKNRLKMPQKIAKNQLKLPRNLHLRPFIAIYNQKSHITAKNRQKSPKIT